MLSVLVGLLLLVPACYALGKVLRKMTNNYPD